MSMPGLFIRAGVATHLHSTDRKLVMTAEDTQAHTGTQANSG